MALRDRLKQLMRRAEGEAVVLHLTDGSRRAFDWMDVASEIFLLNLDYALGREEPSEFRDAYHAATPESRERFLRQFRRQFEDAGVYGDLTDDLPLEALLLGEFERREVPPDLSETPEDAL